MPSSQEHNNSIKLGEATPLPIKTSQLANEESVPMSYLGLAGASAPPPSTAPPPPHEETSNDNNKEKNTDSSSYQKRNEPPTPLSSADNEDNTSQSQL